MTTPARNQPPPVLPYAGPPGGDQVRVERTADTMTITLPPLSGWALLGGMKSLPALLVLSSAWAAGFGWMVLRHGTAGTGEWVVLGASVLVCLVAVLEFAAAYRRRRGPAMVLLTGGDLRVPYPDRGSPYESVALADVADVTVVERPSIFGTVRFSLLLDLRSGTSFTILEGTGEAVLREVVSALRKPPGLDAIRVE